MTELVKQGGALAIQPDQTDWTPAQAAVLQQSGIDDDVTAAELSGFLHLCQRTGLDPFSRQIYLIGRKDKKAGRKVFTPQTGIDGYRVIAHRVIAETREAFGYEDTLWCDTSGRWRDVWLANEAPAAAKVTVLRNGQRFSAVALYREYVQTDWNGNPTRMWKNMGANQIAKCAEALALRKAFPHDLAGVYTAEEMAQADNPQTQPQTQLRAVQAGEPDPWATPAPAAQQRDFVAEARAASNADDVRRIWSDAKAAGLDEKSLGHIAAVGKSLTAQPTEKPAEDSEPIEGEVLSPEESEARAAEQELREWAKANGIEDIDADAESALTMPLRLAPAAAIRGLLAQMCGQHAAA
jgi:phage recombination protein Bet